LRSKPFTQLASLATLSREKVLRVCAGYRAPSAITALVAAITSDGVW
jgi:hypothetical protein